MPNSYKKEWKSKADNRKHGNREWRMSFGLRCLFGPIMIISILLLRFSASVAAPLSTLERRLAEDIEDQRLNDFTKVEAAFILSGVDRSDSLKYYTEWYWQLLDKIRGYPFDRFDPVAAASQVFNYLHTTWLRQYMLESTDLLDIVNRREYNCVSATLLYNLICEDLGWTTEAFETPTHVYTIFRNFTQPVMVENTNPRGFNMIRNLDVYSQHLLQYYPDQMAEKIGLDKLWAYENSKGREIDNTELLGLLAYNRAYFARKRNDFSRAYELVLLAQNFNADSRSNIDFERNLYYQWGRRLFETGKYSQAFTVFADGYYRYPDISDFAQNTRAAFFKSQNDFLQIKTWQPAQRMIREILDLNVLTNEDSRHLSELMWEWKNLFSMTNQADELKDFERLIEQIRTNDD